MRWFAADPTRALLYFTLTEWNTGTELWVSDGTVEGTRLLVDSAPGVESGLPSWITLLGDRVIFKASDAVHGYELWAVDAP
jgi:ELWxxDGT repeat protein